MHCDEKHTAYSIQLEPQIYTHSFLIFETELRILEKVNSFIILITFQFVLREKKENRVDMVPKHNTVQITHILLIQYDDGFSKKQPILSESMTKTTSQYVPFS